MMPNYYFASALAETIVVPRKSTFAQDKIHHDVYCFEIMEQIYWYGLCDIMLICRILEKIDLRHILRFVLQRNVTPK